MLVDLTVGASPALLRALMEGVKRTLIVGSKTGRKMDDPAAVFAAVVASVAPAPEYEPPPLWRETPFPEEIARLTWPMPRKGGA
jgi:hypothetical protein